ncbi:MAG: bifunctional diaminohydroxyphosphoribosylaminopyrimidine deaminase/5-amino-6-(5-phosphoribosylamino)uracil reductase RibD [Clostridiales bacterium]|nr:bifunctional diaminohydroxyphosphoribosylaminopyrimidine deaminase/5-amino-6-(5-phosphoribosylamino)uracil reductase RibD [Clostridiales bacterium]
MDTKYMKRALELAIKGQGKVLPNPMVGAVIVKEGRIIGEGYHKKCGDFHAEVDAFNNASEDVIGAEMYVTLEPCSHYGKTPPCADKIIEKGIKRVYIGMLDPNPLVLGKGVRKLINAGIEVDIGILEEECKRLNEVFIKNITLKTPFVIQKWAMSLDGKIATVSGESKWISGEESRKNSHKLRNEVCGIMVGIGTVLKDDPMLTCRVEHGKNPIRIVVDSSLRIPIESKIVETSKSIRTIIATTDKAKAEKIKVLKNKNIEIIKCRDKNGKVNLKELMDKLMELKIYSILLEGGSSLNYSALEEKIVDKIHVYIAPKILGGEFSKTPVGGNGFKEIIDGVRLKNIEYKTIANDIFIGGYVEKEETCLQV